MTTDNQHKNKITPFTIATFIAVVTLHGYVATALANMEPREIEVPEQKQTPPIEVELVKPIEVKPPEPVERSEPIDRPEPVETKITQPKPVAKHPPKNTPRVPAKKEVIDQVSPITDRSNQNTPDSKTPDSKTPDSKTPDSKTPDSKTPDAKTPDSKTSDPKTSDPKTSDPKTSDPKTSDPGPQHFNDSDAKWIKSPSTTLPAGLVDNLKAARYKVIVTIEVNKSGQITSAKVKKGSGNRDLDKQAEKAVKAAKLEPFIKNGVPVVGIVHVPLNYDID